VLDRLSDRRVHLLVLFGCLLIYLPLAGSYGLWDPWETHYAEVARQMRERGDWISLWWPGSPQDRMEFWSKPVFTFWIEAIMFVLLGIGRTPGDTALSPLTEWAARLPHVLFGVLGVWAVYYAGARLISRRAGVLAALVCATSPLYFFIARQAMTDMPFVAAMTAALCLGAVALLDDDATVPERVIRGIAVPDSPLFYGFAAGFAVLVVPQLIYDSLALRVVIAAGRRIELPGVVAMLPYMACTGWLALRVVRIRKRSQLLLQLAYLLCGVSALAKGLIGVGLPGLVLVLFLLLTWDWQKLRGMDVLSGLLNVVAVSFPWYHAMLIRHGMPFWSELFGDNHWRRLAIGRHGDNSGQFNYYLRELSYGMFPWTAVLAVAVPAALVYARKTTRSGRFLIFTGLWGLLGYALVSISMTKFHHYILPALPAFALLGGWFIDALLAGELDDSAVATALVCAGVPLMLLAIWDLAQTPQSAQRLLWLFNYDYINAAHGRPWPEFARYGAILGGFAVIGGAATGLLGVRWTRPAGAWALGTCAVVFAFFALDKFLIELSPHWGQKHLLATYYQMRQPGERLVAWQVYWRGENFYTGNEIYDPALSPEEKTVFVGDKNQENLSAWLSRHPGQRVFFVVERTRVATLTQLLPSDPARRSLHVVDETNNKFVLAVANL
jgi:4-amino-4-deoxy-L-arabinose transferase-like glycosyltransferase